MYLEAVATYLTIWRAKQMKQGSYAFHEMSLVEAVVQATEMSEDELFAYIESFGYRWEAFRGAWRRYKETDNSLRYANELDYVDRNLLQ